MNKWTGETLLAYIKEQLAIARNRSVCIETTILTECKHMPSDVSKFLRRVADGGSIKNAYNLWKAIESPLGEWKCCVDFYVKLNQLDTRTPEALEGDCV